MPKYCSSLKCKIKVMHEIWPNEDLVVGAVYTIFIINSHFTILNSWICLLVLQVTSNTVCACVCVCLCVVTALYNHPYAITVPSSLGICSYSAVSPAVCTKSVILFKSQVHG